jgi:Methylmalonyl-CoA mutase
MKVGGFTSRGRVGKSNARARRQDIDHAFGHDAPRLFAAGTASRGAEGCLPAPAVAVVHAVTRNRWVFTQEESLYYEHKKHDGSYPIIGVNTFRNPCADPAPQKLELIRSSDEEKQAQLKRLRSFQKQNEKTAPEMLERLRQAVIGNENVFAVLMDAVRVCSLGQITHALFEVGGQYRRNM